MFTSKVNVDKFVQKHHQNFSSERERNQHGYRIGKLYYSCGEYELARKYVSGYLTVVPESAVGHRLLAECLEKLHRKDAALKSYTKSLELDSSQRDLLLKVCELMDADDIFDSYMAQYWCDQAQRFYPNHPTLFKLRERLVLAKKDGNSNEVEKLILSELETCPTDVNLRIRLLQHLLQSNKIKEAYKHAYDLEQSKHNIFSENLSWYETVSEILMRYQNDNVHSNSLDYEFWIYIISVLDKLVTLSLDEQFCKSVLDCTNAVFKFDQTLLTAVDKLRKSSEKKLVQEFTMHYHGQLCLHFATLNFKKAKIDKISFKEASTLNIPLLLGAWSTPPPEVIGGWLTQSSESTKKWIKRWNLEANFRISQAGHVLLNWSALGEKRSNFSVKLTQICSGNWRERLFKMLFVNREQLMKIKSSYFITCPQLSDLRPQLPSAVELSVCDEVAQLLHPSSLHYIVWFALNSKLHEFKCSVFSGLQYSVNDLSHCAAETLNILDIQAFIYCMAACARVIYQATAENIQKPNVLPVAITERISTEAQEKWFKAAYQVYNRTGDYDLGSLRLTLTSGIETIRCIGNHGLNTNLLVFLANTFSQHEKTIKDPIKKEFVAARATLYWNNAIPLLERLKNNQQIIYSKNKAPLFDYGEKEFTAVQINEHLEEGKLYLALKFKEQGEYDRALETLQDLRSPYAMFYQAKIYKLLAEKQIAQNRENVTSEMRSQHIILLSKARDCYYLTLDRLREPAVDRKHPLNLELGTEIENIESMLSRIDPDMCTNQNDCENISDENISSVGSMGDHIQMASSFGVNYTNGSHVRNNRSRHVHSTPFRNIDLDTPRRTEARPSPERLEAQIRQISLTKDTVVTHILEQNRITLESFRTLFEDIRGLTEEFKTSLGKIQEDLNVIKGCFNDQIPMLKKEISELKKDTNKLKSNQINEEDLYKVLDDEYADYGIHTNTTNAFSQSPLYTGFTPGRAPPPLNIPPPALYPPTMYPPMYGYHPALAAATALQPFGDSPQIGDFRNLNLAGPPLIQATSQATSIPALQSVVMPPASVSNIQFPASVSVPSVIPTNLATIPSSKAPPVNVVITASDPVPTNVPTAQPILSVTIPPQHLKKSSQPQPHNYQIPLPAAEMSSSTVTSSYFTPTFSTPSSSSGIFSSLSTTLKTPPKQPIFSTPPTTTPTVTEEANTSVGSIDEYDPCPDFQPIIPLPAEVEVKTGEEGEEVLYKERAKLFRFVDKMWKERGTGDVKLLHNKSTGKVRLLMRRDQVHKICANHFITADIELQTMTTSDRAFMWVANDFADEEVRLEKLCIRFKTPEQANTFFKEFQKAKELLKKDEPKKVEVLTSAPVNLGGFTFSTPPIFDPKTSGSDEAVKEKKPEEVTHSKSSPFANFSFLKDQKPLEFQPLRKPAETSTIKVQPEIKGYFSPKSPALQQTLSEPKKESPANESVEEFEPTTEFSPVIPLPDLVDTVTGEEDEEVVFCERAKLLRFDSTCKEWKERGLGEMKILVSGMARLLMRREQIHKVCCNHQITKTLKFMKVTSNDKAITWGAQDYSEEELKNELFTIRFKTPEIAANFLSKIQELQERMSEDNFLEASSTVSTTIKDEPQGWGDQFKPKAGSWQCSACYIQNDAAKQHCVACETPKDDTVPKKEPSKGISLAVDPNAPKFSFGIPATVAPAVSKPETTSSWGDKFKPKEGSWQCSACYIQNDGSKQYCVACEAPKDATVPKKEPSKGISLAVDPNAPKFSFGIPASTTPAASKSETTSSWGDKFKPKEGSWQCSACYIQNDAGKECCVACETSKDGTAPKKESSTIKGINLTVDPNAPKFSFGIPQASTATPIFGAPKTQESAGFTFGTKVDEKPGEKKLPSLDTLSLGSKTFDFQFNKNTPLLEKPKEPSYTFGSPEKFEFGFTPRSPRKSCGEGGDSDGNVTEDEGEHIHFTPVVPLPDKVDVKTGEEDEEVLYRHRAKLFRFVSGEWKERGLGDVKVLKHTSTGKLRVVMRRDQVLKICLNHALTSNIEYKVKDEKTWMFAAPDFSEGEIVHQQFCLRFKTPEIAGEFKKAVDNALSSGGGASSDSDSDDVILISPIISSELEQKAKDLQLPPNFYSYLNKEPCKGCPGCETDSDEGEKKVENITIPKTTSSFSFSTALKTMSPDTSKIKSIFGGKNTENADSTSEVKSIFGNTTASPEVKSIFGTPSGDKSLLGTPSAEKSIFGTPKSDKPIFETSSSSNKSIFGAPGGDKPSFETPSSNKSIFGAQGGDKPIFETSSNNKSIFGAQGGDKPIFETPSSNKSIFGAQGGDKPIFGTPSTVQPVFGSTPSSAAQPASSIFSTKPIFGNAAGDSKSIFGQSTEASKSIFGGGANFSFGTKNVTPTTPDTTTTTGNIFGGGITLKQPSFNPSTTFSFAGASSVFNPTKTEEKDVKTVFSGGSSIFNTSKPETEVKTTAGVVTTTKPDVSTTTVSSTTSKPAEALAPSKTTAPVLGAATGIFKADAALDFTALAKAANSETFATNANPSFQFEGAGTPVFASLMKNTPTKKNDSVAEDNDESTGDATEEYDPHYEPIVPLPDKIQVTTGEEDEEKLFCERSKLFRYVPTTKEWKERGVGEMKILYHPRRKTYRFVLRREQVHKLVLNQLIRSDIELNPMSTSTSAFCWAGMNYAEEGNGELEKLAVRFKNQQLADQFYACVMSCRKKLAELEQEVPQTVEKGESYDEGDEEYDEEDEDAYNEEAEDEYNEEEDEDDDEREIMWEKHCTLSEQTSPGVFQHVATGEIQICYDSSVYETRILMIAEDGEVVSHSKVVKDMPPVTLEKNTCTWTAIEENVQPYYERTLRLEFDSESAAQEFHYSFQEASQSSI